MDTGPAKVRRVRFNDVSAPVDPIRIIAGIGGILFPILQVLALRYVGFLRPSETDGIAGVIFMIAYALLLPMVYVLYQELAAISRPLGAAVSVAGLGAPLAVAAGVTGASNLTVVTIVIATSLSLWIGLTGVLAFWRRILPVPWALFSAAIGLFALVIAIVGVFAGSNSTSSATAATLGILCILAVAIWTVWTGIMFLLRARMAPTGT